MQNKERWPDIDFLLRYAGDVRLDWVELGTAKNWTVGADQVEGIADTIQARLSGHYESAKRARTILAELGITE